MLSGLLSEGVILIISSVDELVELFFKLVRPFLAEFQLEVIGLKSLILKLWDQFLWLVLLFQADNLSFEVWVFVDEDFYVGTELVNFELEVGSQARNLSSKISQSVHTFRFLALKDFKILSLLDKIVFSNGCDFTFKLSFRIFDLI